MDANFFIFFNDYGISMLVFGFDSVCGSQPVGSCTHCFGAHGVETAWWGQDVEKTAQFVPKKGK